MSKWIKTVAHFAICRQILNFKVNWWYYCSRFLTLSTLWPICDHICQSTIFCYELLLLHEMEFCSLKYIHNSFFSNLLEIFFKAFNFFIVFLLSWHIKSFCKIFTPTMICKTSSCENFPSKCYKFLQRTHSDTNDKS